MTLVWDRLRSVKRHTPIVLLVACSGLMHASVIQSLRIDLGNLHLGSVLSGSVVLPSPLMLGDSAQIPLTFSNPTDYSPASLTATLEVTNGTPEDQFRFLDLSFTNLADGKVYILSVHGAAACPIDFPCQATGRFEANSPPAFSGEYTVTSAPAAVPEPGYSLLMPGILAVLAGSRRLSRQRRSA